MAKKRYKTVTDPFTGRKQKVLKSGYHRDHFSGKIRKSRSYSKTRTRKLTKQEEKMQAIVFGFIAVCVLIYIFFKWVVANPVAGTLVILGIIGIVYFIFKKKVDSFIDSVKSFFGYQEKIGDEAIERILNAIKGMNVQISRDEKEFENQVFQRLDALGFKPKAQVKLGPKKVIDLVVEGNIGLELKIGDRTKNIQDLIGQVTIYKKYISKIIVVILDLGKVEEMDEYTQAIKEIDPDNVHIMKIVAPGTLKRKKKKIDYIMVRREKY